MMDETLEPTGDDGHGGEPIATDRGSGRPIPSSFAVSARMSRQRRRDTRPELMLRQELHRRGLRFRVDYAVPGLPRQRMDIAFTRLRLCVLVDGCFWHFCPAHRTVPVSNREWWLAKLQANVARDRRTDERLRKLGWTVLRFWEHESSLTAADVVEEQIHAGRRVGAP